MTAHPQPTAARLRAFALDLPGAWEDHPWGESVAKVGKKVFVFMGVDGSGPVGVSVKLRDSHEQAMTMPGTEPTGYGLGRAGWVTARASDGGDGVPVEILCDWIEESYRVVAPKRLVVELDQRRAAE